MMSTQPDMILQFSRHLARVFEARKSEPVEVRVDAIASLNGRPSQRLVDPTVDLASQRNGFAHKPWILPLKQLPRRAPAHSMAASGADRAEAEPQSASARR